MVLLVTPELVLSLEEILVFFCFGGTAAGGVEVGGVYLGGANGSSPGVGINIALSPTEPLSLSLKST